MKIVSVEQMKAIERAADASGVSYEMMMKNAGRGLPIGSLETCHIVKALSVLLELVTMAVTRSLPLPGWQSGA